MGDTAGGLGRQMQTEAFDQDGDRHLYFRQSDAAAGTDSRPRPEGQVNVSRAVRSAAG